MKIVLNDGKYFGFLKDVGFEMEVKVRGKTELSVTGPFVVGAMLPNERIPYNNIARERTNLPEERAETGSRHWLCAETARTGSSAGKL